MPERWLSQLILSTSLVSTINNLKAGTGCSLMFDGTVIKTKRPKAIVEYWVATSKTKQPIKKRLEIDFLTSVKWGTPIEERKRLPNSDSHD